MVGLISIAFGLTILCAVIYQMRKEPSDEVWRELESQYTLKTEVEGMKMRIGMFFFRREASGVFNYFNSMKIYDGEHGLYLFPTINHIFLKKLFIPKAELEYVKKSWIFMWRRTIYRVANSNIYIAI